MTKQCIKNKQPWCCGGCWRTEKMEATTGKEEKRGCPTWTRPQTSGTNETQSADKCVCEWIQTQRRQVRFSKANPPPKKHAHGHRHARAHAHRQTGRYTHTPPLPPSPNGCKWETHIEDKVIGELKVCELLVKLVGKCLGSICSLCKVVDGGGQLLVLDADVLVKQLVNLVHNSRHRTRGLFFLGGGRHAQPNTKKKKSSKGGCAIKNTEANNSLSTREQPRMSGTKHAPHPRQRQFRFASCAASSCPRRPSLRRCPSVQHAVQWPLPKHKQGWEGERLVSG